MHKPKNPDKKAIQEAKNNPGGWVYEIAPQYNPELGVPPEGIMGAWKVNEDGIIDGEYIPNPDYVPPKH